MQIKSTILFLTIFLQILFVPSGAKSITFQENPLTKAIQLFDREKFSEAEPLFKKILDQRPDDFMVNYFYGACRTENGHFAEQDLNYLIKASKEVTPLNIDYYFAIQYHAKNQWEKATVYYKLYKEIASVNEQEKVKLSEKMEQCANHVNPFVQVEVPEAVVDTATTVVAAEAVLAVVSEPDLTETDSKQVAVVVVSDSEKSVKEEEIEVLPEIQESDSVPENNSDMSELVIDSIVVQQPSENKVPDSVQAIQKDERIDFNINDEITYLKLSNFKTAEGELYFKEGNIKKTELDEIIKRTENLRSIYTSSDSRGERDSIGIKILELESWTYELKKVVNQLFAQAKTADNGYWQNVSPVEKETFIKELNVLKEEEIKNATVAEKTELIVAPILIEKVEEEKPAPKTNNSGITYKIQIGAYSRGIPNNMKSVFNKISLIRKVDNYTDEKGIVVYTTGNLTNYEDAVVMQNQIKQEGVKDPIIAAYLNGKRINLEQAKQTEKQK